MVNRRLLHLTDKGDVLSLTNMRKALGLRSYSGTGKAAGISLGQRFMAVLSENDILGIFEDEVVKTVRAGRQQARGLIGRWASPTPST